MIDYHGTYLFGVSLWLLVWAIFFYLRPDIRKEMLIMSFGMSWLGITELLYVGSYWTPLYFFPIGNLPLGLEDFLLCFAYGGLVTALYKVLLKERSICPTNEHFLHSCKLVTISIIPGSLLFFVLIYFTHLNIIYSTTAGMLVIGLTHLFLRPKLSRVLLLNGFFVGTFAFLTLIAMNTVFPGAITAMWNLNELSGYTFIGIPIEEIINHYTLGLAFGLMYEIQWHCRVVPFRRRL